MADPHFAFAADLAKHVRSTSSALREHPHNDTMIQALNEQAEAYNLDLTPFRASPAVVSAKPFFQRVTSIASLITAYRLAKQSKCFEEDLPEATSNVSDYAAQYLETILESAKQRLSDQQAITMATWVAELDIYTAVRAVESLLNSRADLTLLEIAPHYGWSVHFDHLAIRCGVQARQDAERVVELLQQEHGYIASQLPHEAYYQFSDGWNAYPVYKILENGQVLRIFVDQSDADYPEQIIQHWNRVYGYTAHHLALRATRVHEGQRIAVPLEEVIASLQQHDVKILTPTGHYTEGLLLQVFTKPELNLSVPNHLKRELSLINNNLEKTIENGKLLELVSRKEMPVEFAQRYFRLYGLEHNAANPLHSAPIYQYFLPAQAAHVIKTSQQL